MYSPALQSSIQQPFHPHFPIQNQHLQTPMQPFFVPQHPPPPSRPSIHQSQQSIAQLAAAGIYPPNGFPITSMGGHFPRQSMGVPPQGQPSAPPFPHRNRRQLSIGGPPKAVLGGPARKLSPLPVVQPPNPTSAPPKAKKLIVNLPKETILGADGKLASRPSWARTPLYVFQFTHQSIPAVETTTTKIYPADRWARHMPNTIDVFLPGKRAWDELKQKAIEEKLEKLGVERGSGSNVPHIHAPHARAASISSPADPQLLLFKLNKLQQSQEAAASENLAPSPNPSFGFSPSPSFTSNKHAHTMSLATMPPHPFFEPAATSFDPFGSNPDTDPSSYHQGIIVPQGRVPVASSSLFPPQGSSRPASRPDFIRGFGLDIPEEEEGYAEEQAAHESGSQHDADISEDMDLDEAEERETELPLDGTATASQSRFHSRHVSKLSAALSIRSAGALEDDAFDGEDEEPSLTVDPGYRAAQEDLDLADVIGEWTGSEDVNTNKLSDGEQSIGEWSNPSDEERARHERMERRMRQTSQQVDQPRRLPNFPRPPDNTIMVPVRQDDDIISNPSEEEHIENHREYLGVDYYSRPPSNSGSSSRPLPPLPHSRVTSGQHTAYDPAHAHSRTPSNHQQTSLNPFARPFVFGAASSGSWGVQTPPGAPLISHSRLPSIGKPLNVAAPEFKPSGFTFRPPAGVPQMPPAPAPDVRHPLPVIPSVELSPFKVQGREKRQRRGSTASMEEGDSMSSFKFPPNPESPQSIRHTRSVSGSVGHMLNPSPEPFTFAGFSAVATLPYVPKDTHAPAEPVAESTTDPAENLDDDSTAKGNNGEAEVDTLELPSTSKPKRAPIPLDFKHPVSNNTVPAGLFKALVNNGDDRTRRTVRSRLGSREIYDQLHRPSMDDTDVPTISHKAPRGRLVTDPGELQTSPLEDVFGSIRHTRRQSSLPDALRDNEASPVSPVSSNPEEPQDEQRIEVILKEGLATLRQALKHESEEQHASTRTMISELQSLFRTELQDSAVRSLDDSQMSAHGEMDFQLFKGVVEDGNKELMTAIKRDIQELQLQLWQAHNSNGNIQPIVEQIGSQTINAVIEAVSELSARQEAIGRVAPARERDATVDKLMTVLTPVLSSLRSEPIDYEFLTSQLTQAVKPHISQLIDLASDKRETASLIVDRILPLLPSRQMPALDTDALTLHLTAEVRRAIAPIDAFEIKEQVADLVVERLDSRLSVRDKAFNGDTLSGKIVDGVSGLLHPIQGVTTSVDEFVAKQEALFSQQSELASGHNHLIDIVSNIPLKLAEVMDALKATQTDVLSKLAQSTVPAERDENILHVKTSMESLEHSQQSLLGQTDELRVIYQEILNKLNALPDTFHAATDDLQDRHAEFLTSHDASRREMDEIRKLNSDLQIQLTKARGAHGQVRVEKDALSEKIGVVEGDRDRLRGQMKELQVSNAGMAAQINTLEARNSDLEEALAKALVRLQASDVATQANQNRINDLEKTNCEYASEKQALQSKVDSLDLQVTLVTRDKESALQALTTLQQQHDNLASQQSHWNALHKASEKIEMLTTLIGQADNEELKDLRLQRDRSKVLEGEHAALQKRCKEQESKILNIERAAVTTRQSLAQAQQRSSEWERRAKEYEAQLESTQTKLDQAEQTHTQLDADYSLVKLQLEEREADDRLAQDLQSKMRDQVVVLEAQVKRLQSEIEQANMAKATTIPYRNITNGNTHTLPRPDSRTSTIYHNRSVTPQRRMQSQVSSDRSDTPPQPSVWDSMHAPTNMNVSYKRPAPVKSIPAPKGRYPDLGPTTSKAIQRSALQYYPTTPSPTPSTLSLAPTQGDDGWWS